MPGNTPEAAGFFARRRELPAAAVAANPAAGATLSDPTSVTGRFATPQSRRPVVIQEDTHA